MICTYFQRLINAFKQPLETNAQEDNHQRPRKVGFFEEGYFLPSHQEDYRQHAYDCRPWVKVVDHGDNRREGVFMIVLKKGHVTFWITIMPNDMGNLL